MGREKTKSNFQRENFSREKAQNAKKAKKA